MNSWLTRGHQHRAARRDAAAGAGRGVDHVGGRAAAANVTAMVWSAVTLVNVYVPAGDGRGVGHAVHFDVGDVVAEAGVKVYAALLLPVGDEG